MTRDHPTLELIFFSAAMALAFCCIAGVWAGPRAYAGVIFFATLAILGVGMVWNL